MSMTASGKLGNAIVFLNWKGAPTVRIWKRPYNPKSTGQVSQRNMWTQAVIGWQSRDAATKADWNAYAEIISDPDKPVSGFNLFMRTYIHNFLTVQDWDLIYPGWK